MGQRDPSQRAETLPEALPEVIANRGRSSQDQEGQLATGERRGIEPDHIRDHLTALIGIAWPTLAEHCEQLIQTIEAVAALQDETQRQAALEAFYVAAGQAERVRA